MAVKISKVNITKVNPSSLGKVIALVAGVSGFFFGFLWILLMGMQAIELGTREIMIMLAFIFIIPVIYGAIGYVTGIFIATMFNLITGIISNSKITR